MTFKGTVSSDFMKLVNPSTFKKSGLIDFAGSDFDTIRLNLVSYIRAVYPEDYNNFVSSDLGAMLIDLVAYVGSVTSMKSDFLANENYLRTAKNRNSIKKLLELIGVKLKGPTAALANASLVFDTSPFQGATSGLPIDIPFEGRVYTVDSPEDGEPVSYTLYKTQNGLLEYSNTNGGITLSRTESSDGNGLVFDNLALIEGSLAIKTGTFPTGRSIKFVQLDLSPIIEGSVEVFIEGNPETSGTYTETENLFFVEGSSAKVFQLISDDDFKSTVVFGDNVLAQSPAAGDRFTITYRVGGGSRGNLPKSYLSLPVTVLSTQNVSIDGTLENSSQATGGADAETIEQAKKYAPLSFRRQDRLVTISDYQTYANSFRASFGLVGKAVASVRKAFSSANIIDIYLLEKANDLQLKKASPAFKKELLDSIAPKKMITDEVVAVDGLIRTLDVIVTIRISRELLEDEEVIKSNVGEVIENHFLVGNREFGQRFIPQDLAREIFELPEVIFATVDNFEGSVFVDFNEFIQLNNYTINIEKV